MGKAQKKKRPAKNVNRLRKKSSKAESVCQRRSENKQAKVNSFEVKVNKQKHHALGKLLGKSDRGTPGITRGRGIDKRKNTLLLELKKQYKVNKMLDRRLGENNPNTSLEDKMMERFTKENKKQHGNPNLFKLDDDDNVELTHGGQSLREIEKFDKPESSDDETGGMLSGPLVSEGHFGGGMLQKKDPKEEEKSWKDRMAEMIAKSKQAKADRQSEKDETMILTDEIDAEWRQLHNLVTINKRADSDVHASNNDDFDMTVRQLQFEIKGNPSDRMKSEKEIAQEEMENLQRLEEERILRMRGVTLQTHQSADQLDDGFDLDDDENDDEMVVLYKDGKLVNPIKTDTSSTADDRLERLIEEDETDESEEDGESAVDEFSDMDTDKLSDEDSDYQEETTTTKTDSLPKPTKSSIPFTFEVPGSYDDLVKLLDEYPDPADQDVVIIRILKCNHASLAEGNKEKLAALFKYLMEYFGDVALRTPVPIELLDILTKHLYHLAQLSPNATAQHAKDVILEKRKLFSDYCDRKAGRGVWPFLDVLLYFKLLSHLYPTSDFRHEVITPTMIFASQIYSSCAVKNHRDIAVGLFLTTSMLEYISFSGVLMPEAVCFLTAILHSALPNVKAAKVKTGTCVCKSRLLALRGSPDVTRQMKMRGFSLNQVICRGVGNSIYDTDEFSLTAVHVTLTLLEKFSLKYRTHATSQSMFSSVREILPQLPVDSYPQCIAELAHSTQEVLNNAASQKLAYVCRERKKPKLLRLYEPQFEETFELKKLRSGSGKPVDREQAERNKLKKQYKREKKGAIREIRKDQQFIHAQKLKDALQRDKIRQSKLSQIMGDLQQSQYEKNMHVKFKEDSKRKF